MRASAAALMHGPCRIPYWMSSISVTKGAVATIVLLAGCAFAVAMPAVQAMTPDLVGADDLLGAMSLGAAQFNLGRVVGPALAGLVITAGGLAWAFGLNVVSFGAVLLALALIRIPPLVRGEGERPRVLRTVADGVVAAKRDPGIRTALLLLVATTFLVSPFIGLVPAVAIKVFGRGAGGTSALVTAQGVGAVCSALAAGPLAGMLGRRRLLVAALLLVGPAAVAYGLACLEAEAADSGVRSLISVQGSLAMFGICWMLQGAANLYYLVFFSVLIGLWVLWFVVAPRRLLPALLLLLGALLTSTPAVAQSTVMATRSSARGPTPGSSRVSSGARNRASRPGGTTPRRARRASRGAGHSRR